MQSGRWKVTISHQVCMMSHKFLTVLYARISKSKAPTLISKCAFEMTYAFMDVCFLVTRIDDFDPQDMIREFKLQDSIGPVYTSWKAKKEQAKKATKTALGLHPV